MEDNRLRIGCIISVITVLLTAFIYAGVTNGIEGIGTVFFFIGFAGVCVAVGRNELELQGRAISLAIGLISGFIGYNLVSVGSEKNQAAKIEERYNSLNDHSSIKEYRDVVARYYYELSNSQGDKLINQYYKMSLDTCVASIGQYAAGERYRKASGLGFLEEFIENCPNSTFREKAQAKIDELADSLYSEAKRINSHKGWCEYQNAVPSTYYKDSNARLEYTNPRWNSDRNAWKTALSLNTVEAYNKYLWLYPKGRHRAEADKRVIDKTVATAFSDKHGSLPKMDKTGYDGGSTSLVSVNNLTAYTLTLMYSGIESKRLVLSPHSKGSIKLKNGIYRIVATANAPNVRDFAGTETLNGGSYSINYHIQTIPYHSYRHY